MVIMGDTGIYTYVYTHIHIERIKVREKEIILSCWKTIIFLKKIHLDHNPVSGCQEDNNSGFRVMYHWNRQPIFGHNLRFRLSSGVTSVVASENRRIPAFCLFINVLIARMAQTTYLTVHMLFLEKRSPGHSRHHHLRTPQWINRSRICHRGPSRLIGSTNRARSSSMIIPQIAARQRMVKINRRWRDRSLLIECKTPI